MKENSDAINNTLTTNQALPVLGQGGSEWAEDAEGSLDMAGTVAG